MTLQTERVRTLDCVFRSKVIGDSGGNCIRAGRTRRLPRLLGELAIARADGSSPRRLASLAKTEVLLIDDFGLAKLTAESRRDLLGIIEDHHGIRSTVATSQLPVEKWHDAIADPTLADAILGRLVHNACQLDLRRCADAFPAGPEPGRRSGRRRAQWPGGHPGEGCAKKSARADEARAPGDRLAIRA